MIHPVELFTHPDNLFVAGFIGSPAMNLLDATVSDGAARVGSLVVPLTTDQLSTLTTDAVVIGVRPETFNVATEGGLDAEVEMVEELGSESYLYCLAPGVEGKQVTVRTEGLSPSSRGDRISLVPGTGSVHVFDAATGARLEEG